MGLWEGAGKWEEKAYIDRKAESFHCALKIALYHSECVRPSVDEVNAMKREDYDQTLGRWACRVKSARWEQATQTIGPLSISPVGESGTLWPYKEPSLWHVLFVVDPGVRWRV